MPESSIYSGPYGGSSGGLDQSAVDARVLVGAAGYESVFVYPNMCYLGSFTSLTNINTATPAISFQEHGSIYPQAHFSLVFPDKWDGGQIRWRYFWAPSTTNTGQLQMHVIGQFLAEGDAIGSGGTANLGCNDTPLGVVNDLQVSPWSSFATVDGSGGPNKLFVGRIQRQAPTDGFTGNALVVIAQIQYTVNKHADA